MRGEPCRARPGRPARTRLWLWARRNRSLATASALTGVSLVAVAVFALLFAIGERKHARELALRLAESDLDRGLAWCEGGEVAHGMLLMAKGLSAAPSDAREVSRVLSTNLAAWHEQLDPLLAVQGHGGPITEVAFSPDGKLAATGGENHMVRLWDGSAAAPHAGPIDCNDAIRSLVFSPDSRILIIVCREGKLLAWDVSAGRFCPVPFEHGEKTDAIAYSHDGKTIAIEGRDNRLRFWNAAAGRPLPVVLDLRRRTRMVAFGPDDKTIVTVTVNGVIQRWDMNKGTKSDASAIHEGLRAAALSRDGRWLATGSRVIARPGYGTRPASSSSTFCLTPAGSTLLLSAPMGVLC